VPNFLIAKLKKEYPHDEGAPYAILNSKGYMKGSKETAKGRSIDKKHAIKIAMDKRAKLDKNTEKE
jgi:hypothetical protein